VDAGRRWLKAHLPDGEPVEIRDPALLDLAAAILLHDTGAVPLGDPDR
jgi:hypothetical protein